LELDRRIQNAMDALPVIRQYADSFIGICLEEMRIPYGSLPFDTAMGKIKESLHQTITSLVQIINLVGAWNIDINDIKAIMSGSGDAVIRTGISAGPGRARKIFDQMVKKINPSYQHFSGLSNLLIHFVWDQSQLSLDEMSDLSRQFLYFREVRLENLQLGIAEQPGLHERIMVTAIATGIPARDFEPVYRKFFEDDNSWLTPDQQGLKKSEPKPPGNGTKPEQEKAAQTKPKPKPEDDLADPSGTASKSVELLRPVVPSPPQDKLPPVETGKEESSPKTEMEKDPVPPVSNSRESQKKESSNVKPGVFPRIRTYLNGPFSWKDRFNRAIDQVMD
jgi:cell division protein FtsZ